MSGFFSKRYSRLVPYTPGEQPRDTEYIKLNTNESPYPPAAEVVRAAETEAGRLQLYSDPQCAALRRSIAELYDTDPSCVTVSNGSDEVLNFAFMAFSDEERPLAFPDITYGFYPVFAELGRIPYTEIPLRDDFTVNPEDYIGIGRTVVIANPNAPTGIFMPLCDIERIVRSNPHNVVIVDEAYVDFGGTSAVRLTKKYSNLLVTQTFSKSRSLAGARLGFGIGDRSLIDDIETLRYSTNPYNVNRMTEAAGCAAIAGNSFYMEKCAEIARTRENTGAELLSLGFEVTPSMANFLFVRSDLISGAELYSELKKRGILIRHFEKERIADYNRITVGTPEQMNRLISEIKNILGGKERK